MKLKLILLLIVCSFGIEALAYNSIVNKKSYSYLDQPSSIVRSSHYNETSSVYDLNIIIDDLNSEINKNPENYTLYVPLVDAYIRNKNFNEAFDILKLLLEKKDEGALSQEVINNIKTLSNRTAAANKYSLYRSPININLAVMNLITDNFSQAETCIKRSVSNMKDYDLLLNAIQLVFDYTGNNDEAIAVCNFASSLYRDDLSIKILKINYLIPKGNLPSIITEYNYILANGEDINESAKYNIYKLMETQKASDKEIFNVLFKKDKNNEAACYLNLYTLLVNAEDYDSAKKYMEKIQKEYPDSLQMALLNVELLVGQGKRDEAEKILTSVKDKIETEEDIIRYNNALAKFSEQPIQEGAQLFWAGHYDRALEIFNAIPDSPLVLSQRARCYMELNRMQEAINTLNRALSMTTGDDPSVNYNFAVYYFKNKDYSTAREYAKIVEKKKDSFSKEFEKAFYLFMNQLNAADAEKYINQIISSFDAQNHAETMRLIDEALKIDPNSSVLYFYRGLAYIDQSNYAASTASLYKSIELDPNNALAYYFLGIAFDNLSEYKNALIYYKKFLEILPANELGESERAEYAQTRINALNKLM